MIRAWLASEAADAVRVLDDAAVSEARERTRSMGRAVGLTGERLERLVAAVSELAQNQLLHGGGGLIAVRPCARGTVPGLEVIAADRGPGIADPLGALRSTTGRVSGTLGVGVSAIRRLTDELDIDVRRGQGTCFWARKYAEAVTRRREVGVWSQPKAGEASIGDDAVFIRTEGRLLVAVADGLGHGAAAGEASTSVMEVLRGCAADDLAALVLMADEAARDTRGAALSLIKIDEAFGKSEGAAVGNVSAFVRQRDGSTKHLAGSSWTVGGKPRTTRAVRPESVPLGPDSAIILFSDGVSGSAVLEPGLLLEHPLAAAYAIASTFGRTTDDVTVLVAK